MFGARFGPTSRMPTLLYLAGVPGDGKPAILWNLVAADADTGAAQTASAIRRTR